MDLQVRFFSYYEHMRICVDVNGVLRDTLGKFTRIYENFLVENNLEIDENNLITTGVTDDFKYEFNGPITSLTLNEFFKFRDDDDLKNFMYEEFPMQIFGHASSTEMNTFIILNEFYNEFRDNHKLTIVSNEVGKTKPATLFFLSKFGCLFENVMFYSNYTKNLLWDNTDILITANNDLLLNYPQGKIIIKFETDYNTNIESTFSIKSLSELPQLIKNIIK